MFALRASGPIYTEPWIQPAQRLTFSCLPDEMQLRRNASFRTRCEHLDTLAHASSTWMGTRPKVISELKKTGELGRRCRCRPVRYLNNVVEQDHRAIKRRVRACQGFRAFHSARRTIQGIEVMNMIRKGQIRWVAKGDTVGQVAFVGRLFGLTTA
jgi:hypothetical protein